ncbi:mechanosensitive ion channel family protein [Haladaptatus sp. NG-SE-30]
MTQHDLFTSTVLQIDGLPGWLQDPISGFIALLPRLVGALVILLIGWVIGRAVAAVVRRIADRIELDRMVLDTPLGRMLGGTERAVSGAFGKLAAWFIYALAILAAANVLAIATLSEWVATAVSYLPALIAGLLVIVLGFVVADFIGDAIMRTRAATHTAYTQWFATGTRLFLYFTAIVIGLDTMGIDVGILYLFARALAWGLAAAIAIGVGVAFGWGGRDYVAEHIEGWMSSARQGSPSPQPSDDD